MAEKTLPWWRKALSYALEGIRSGFGLFTRAAKPAPSEPPPLQEKPEEELEEETLLPKQSDNPKAAAVPAVMPEPVSQPETTPAVLPEPVEKAEDTPAVLPVPTPEVEAVVEPVETIASVAAPEALVATAVSIPDPDKSAAPALEPIPEPVFDPIFSSPPEPEAIVAEEALEPKPAAEPELHPAAPEAEKQPSEVEQATQAPGSVTGHDFSRAEDAPITTGALAPEAQLIELETLDSDTEHDVSPAEDTPMTMETSQPAEKLPLEADSISTEGGGGFTPRTTPTELMGALAPEADSPQALPESSSSVAISLYPEEKVVEPERSSSVTEHDFTQAEDPEIATVGLAPEEHLTDPEPTISVTEHDVNPAEDAPTTLETVPPAEELQAGADSVWSEGVGGFNPRITPAGLMRASAPEDDFPPAPPDFSDSPATSLVSDEHLTEPEPTGPVTERDFNAAEDTPITAAASAPEEHLVVPDPEIPGSVTGHDFGRAEDTPITVGALAPEEQVIEVALDPALAAEPPSDSTPSEPQATVEDSVESLPAPEPAGAADESPAAAQVEPEPETETETPQTEEMTAEPVAVPSPEAQTAQPADIAETTVIEPPTPEAPPVEQQIEPTAELQGTAEQAQADAPVAEPQTPAAVEATAAPEPAPPEPAAPPVVDEKAAARLAARQKKLADADEQSPFSVMVDHVYDGPLDLLLDLIRKQDIDIYDIPISKITSQFLAYVNQLRAGDVDVAGEFIYIASLLIHIKSKMLLPRAPAGPEDTPEDPRRELVERLLEHERFKNAAQMLQQKQMLEAASWTNPGAQEFKDDEAAEPEIAADTVDLVRIFRDILERARTRPTINVTEDQVTVAQMIQFLSRRLTMEDKPVALRRLLSHTRSERSLIAMFLALLELVRLQAILLRQDRAFSEIFIKKNTNFDSVMNEGLVNARDDWK